MRKSKGLIALCMLLAVTFVFTACGSKTAETPKEEAKKVEEPKKEEPKKEEPKKEVKLVVATNAVGEWAKVLQDISSKFSTENPDVKIDFQAPGKEYENIMKIKMAAKDMPDVFSTHGWAKVRYGNFLADLKSEEWVSRISPAIKDSVSDDKGKVYILPFDWEKGGFVYNVEVLQKYGIEVPKTIDELAAACEAIKTKSNGAVIPIHCGAADNWMMGQIFDVFGIPMAVSSKENFQKELLDGSYDWYKFQPLPEKMAEFVKKGYFNKDVLTSKFTDSAKALGEGKAAFVIHGPWMIDEAKKTSPNFKGGVMPVPSIAAGDEWTFSGGEKTTYGAWVDSKVLDTAKKFITFNAKTDNIKAVCENTKLPSGLNDVKPDLGDIGQYYDKYKDVRVFTYFDRVFLPNGMWDPMCKAGQDLFANGITPKQFCETMKKEYDRLRKAAQ